MKLFRNLIATILKIILTLLGLAVGWILLIKLVRRYYHFPAPAFVVRFLDSPLRKRVQPPELVLDWIGISSGMQVLEVGPGPGTFTAEAARRVGPTAQVHAIDIQPELVELLDQRMAQQGVTNVDARVASAYELPYPDKSFDRVFMVTVLAEIPDRQRALLEFRRVLKDNGLLSISELVTDPDYPRAQTVSRWCQQAGFRPVMKFGTWLHFVYNFEKVPNSGQE